MSRTIHCSKLDIDAEGLDFAPWPGPLGQRIYAEISKPAWQQWLAHQTMLINEYRLNPLDPQVAQLPQRGNGEIPVRRRRRHSPPDTSRPTPSLDEAARIRFNARLHVDSSSLRRCCHAEPDSWPGSSVGRAGD